MDSHLMTHHPQCTIKMICEEFNIDIQRVLMNIKQVNILIKIHSKNSFIRLRVDVEFHFLNESCFSLFKHGFGLDNNER